MCLSVCLKVCVWNWERDFSPPLSLVRFGGFHKSTAFFFTYKNYRPNDFSYFFLVKFQEIGTRKIVCVFAFLCVFVILSRLGSFNDWFCCFCKFKLCEVECEYDLKSRCNCFTELCIRSLYISSSSGVFGNGWFVLSRF